MLCSSPTGMPQPPRMVLGRTMKSCSQFRMFAFNMYALALSISGQICAESDLHFPFLVATLRKASHSVANAGHVRPIILCIFPLSLCHSVVFLGILQIQASEGASSSGLQFHCHTWFAPPPAVYRVSVFTPRCAFFPHAWQP